MEFSVEVHDGHVGAASLLFRCQPSARLGPAPEDRRHRRGGRIFRRARSDDPALGHQRARRRQSAPGRSRRQAVPAVSRCPVHGRWRSRRRPSGTGREPLAGRRLHGRKQQSAGRRPLAGLGAGAGPRHRYGDRADGDQDRARSGCGRGRAAVRGLHQRGKPLHLYREPVHQHHRDCQRAGAADAGCAFASGPDRHAEDAFVLVRVPGHAGRPRRVHRRVRRGRRHGQDTLSLPRDAGCNLCRCGHGAQQGDDRRRLFAAHRLRQPQQPLDGRRHRVRSRLRGDIRREQAIHHPAPPRAYRPFLRCGRTGNRRQ